MEGENWTYVVVDLRSIEREIQAVALDFVGLEIRWKFGCLWTTIAIDDLDGFGDLE